MFLNYSDYFAYFLKTIVYCLFTLQLPIITTRVENLINLIKQNQKHIPILTQTHTANEISGKSILHYTVLRRFAELKIKVKDENSRCVYILQPKGILHLKYILRDEKENTLFYFFPKRWSDVEIKDSGNILLDRASKNLDVAKLFRGRLEVDIFLAIQTFLQQIYSGMDPGFLQIICFMVLRMVKLKFLSRMRKQKKQQQP